MVHVFVFFVFLMVMAPSPVRTLFFVLEMFVIDIRFVPRFQPAPVHLVFPPIPVVIVPVIRVIHPSFSFLLLVPLVIILRRGHSKGAHRRQ